MFYNKEKNSIIFLDFLINSNIGFQNSKCDKKFLENDIIIFLSKLSFFLQILAIKKN